jgi:hypothetical protein
MEVEIIFMDAAAPKKSCATMSIPKDRCSVSGKVSTFTSTH